MKTRWVFPAKSPGYKETDQKQMVGQRAMGADGGDVAALVPVVVTNMKPNILLRCLTKLSALWQQAL